jgi:hypothetical protein
MDSVALNRAEVFIRKLGMKMNFRPPQSPPNIDVTNSEVYRFQCEH